jgi:hypothetical protein
MHLEEQRGTLLKPSSHEQRDGISQELMSITLGVAVLCRKAQDPQTSGWQVDIRDFDIQIRGGTLGRAGWDAHSKHQPAMEPLVVDG